MLGAKKATKQIKYIHFAQQMKLKTKEVYYGTLC